MKTAILVISALTLVGVPNVAQARTFSVYFRPLALAKGEYVEGLRLTVSCGHVQAIGAIPVDWDIEVQGMESAKEQLTASAGHGASRLPGLTVFNGAIVVQNIEPQCFAITGIISVSGGDADRDIKL